MKKLILSLLVLFSALFSLPFIAQASTLDSIDIYLKFESLEQSSLSEQLAPTSITDAGEETINTYSGTVSYYSEELNLPGINGFDLTIGRKFNSANDADIYGTSRYITISGYNNLNFPDMPMADGVKYVFPYYLTTDYSGDPIFIAYDSIGDMLIAENNTAAINIKENYEDYFINISTDQDIYKWAIGSDYEIGFSHDSAFMIYDDIADSDITLYRDTTAGYAWLDSTIEQSYYYTEGLQKEQPLALGGGWEYVIPSVVAWDYGSDEEANTDCVYGMFYDPHMKRNVNFRFRYDGDYFLDACCNTDMGFYEVPYDENDFYCIKAEYTDGDFSYYIRRYDGVKFYFVNDKFQYMEDRFGNKIEYSYSADDDTITIVDTLNRTIVLSKNGISVNGVDVVKYTFAINNNDVEDPDDILVQDDSGVFTASYKVSSSTYKTITYNMSQQPKAAYPYYQQHDMTQAVSYSKAVIDSVTISTGATRYYSYDGVLRYTHTTVSDEDLNQYSSYHPYREPACVERYDVQPDSTTLENYQAYSYNDSKSSPATTITFQDRDDYTITETYNTNGFLYKRVTECTDLDYILTETYGYSSHNRVPLISSKTITKENADGLSTSYSDKYQYSDSNNQLTRITRDSVVMYEATYSDFGLLETEYYIYGTDEYRGIINTITDGNITEKTYATKTNRTAAPIKKETVTYTYDSYGNVASIDGDGAYVEYTYEYGDYTNNASPSFSIRVTETYPAVDNITDSQGVDIPSADVTKTTYYNRWGFLVKQIDGEGNTTKYSYDYRGRVTKVTNPDNTTKTYKYNDTKNQIYITNEDGTKNMNAFDLLGREKGYYYLDTDRSVYAIIYFKYYDTYSNLTRCAIYGGNGVDGTTRYTYYSDGSLKTEIMRNGLYTSGDILTSNTYTYSIPEENLNAVSVARKKNDTENITITNYTNQYGFKVKDTIDDGAEVVEQVYTTDVAGNITKVKDLRGKTAHTYTYDYRGRVLKDTYPIGSTTNVYDDAFLYQVKDGLSNIIKTYEYNTMGQLIRETTPIDDDTDNITEYYYDRNSNLTKTVTATGDGTTTKTVSNIYDNRNRLIAADDGSGYYTRYEYDSMANITRMATGVPTVTEALDRTTHSVTDYEYSYRGFLTGVTDPMGYTESYTYNSQGIVRSSVDKNGTTFAYTYDGMYRILSKTATGTDSTTQTISYAYDNLGNVTKTVDENGTTLYTYDRLGNILTETRGTLAKTYTYDANGNRISADITDGTFTHSLTYTYDNNNRLTKVEDDNGYTDYTYDKNNRILTEKTYTANNAMRAYTDYTYYDSGLLNTKENRTYSSTASKYVVNEYALTYYNDGNIASITDINDVVTSYVYDDANRLISESIDGVVQASYTYDAFGNRATKTEPDRVTTYAYNKNNRLGNAITEGDGIYLYHYYDYDKNGNLKEDYSYDSCQNYYYDLFGNLIRAYTENNVTIATYTYDGNGIRLSKTTPDRTINYINDGGYVVGEVSSDSIIKYTYGTDLISINNNGTLGYYHTDEHGNVSAITDTSRNVVANYDFDAFGNETVSTDTYYNPMRYCGEYYDSETGLIYLRARYYDPSIGRFISEDPAKDGTNWYVYCNNNPVMFVDPSGLEYGDVVDFAKDLSIIFGYYNVTTTDSSLEVQLGANYRQKNGVFYFDGNVEMPIAGGRRYTITEKADNINGSIYMEREDFYKAMNIEYVTVTEELIVTSESNTWTFISGVTSIGVGYYTTPEVGVAIGVLGLAADLITPDLPPGTYIVKTTIAEVYNGADDNYQAYRSVEYWMTKTENGGEVTYDNPSEPNYSYKGYWGFYGESNIR